MEKSILTSIKKMLGPEEDYEHFDHDIITHINTALATLTELGVGPEAGFSITDKTAVWNDFSAPLISASTSMSVGGKAVATKEYVDGKIPSMDGYATQKWVEDKKYLTGIPGTCNASVGFYAPYIRATSGMSVGGKAVATQEWVTSQLASYAKSDHTHSGYASNTHSHAWSSITNKPSSFTPSSHKHSFSFNIGHTHTYTKPSSGGTSANTGGMSKNYNVSGNTASN